MKQTVAFLTGVIFSTVFQWGKWTTNNKGKPFLCFWKEAGFTHIMLNAGIDAGVWALWSLQVLDKFINMGLDAAHLEMKEFRDMGIPYTPQVGIMVGFAADMVAEPLAYLFGKLVLSRLPFLSKAEEPPKGGTDATGT